MAVQRLVLGDVEPLRDAMNRWMEESYARSRRLLHGSDAIDVPVDLYDAGDHYVMRAMLPGAQPAEVEVTSLGDTVRLRGTIHMHQADPKRDVSWLVHEVPHGNFSRVIALPQRIDADRAEATFDAGILTVRLPKAERQARQIKVNY